MAIQIPSNLPVSNIVDFQRNDLISPPSAPAIVESLSAIDPRVALNMPMPVVNSAAGHALHDAIQDAVAKSGSTELHSLEPRMDKAVLLEISSRVGQNRLIAPENQRTDMTNLLSQNLSRIDQTGSAALGQLLSDILEVDVPELGKQITTQNNQKLPSEAVVNWPNAVSTNSGQIDPKVALNLLYQNLQNSGIFAADQLKSLVFPTSVDADGLLLDVKGFEEKAAKLMAQVSADSPSARDSVKLLLRGDLLWQGQLMPRVEGRLYREDCWTADPNDPNQLQKGSQLTMDVTLPNLGPIKVIGTQFGETVQLSIQAADLKSQELFTKTLRELIDQVHSQIDSDVYVSIKNEGLPSDGS